MLLIRFFFERKNETECKNHLEFEPKRIKVYLIYVIR